MRRPETGPTWSAPIRGTNAKQVQRWLGHHKPSFTLDTYIHLLSDDRGEPLDLSAELAQGGFKVAPRPVSAGLGRAGAGLVWFPSEAGWPSLDEGGLRGASPLLGNRLGDSSDMKVGLCAHHGGDGCRCVQSTEDVH